MTETLVSTVVEQVPRHRFIPDRIWDGTEPVDRTQTPDRWWQLVDADTAVVTQIDEGRVGGMGVPTSSSSAPSVVAAMLDALDVQPGQQVLEIGTGTGWNAALLCELVGDADRVTTIEVDPVVAAQARKALGAAGYEVRVVVGDGAEGFPALAPYDRIIATCAVWEVPHAWLTQVRDGGIIVTPWSPQRFGPHGALARLQVRDGAAEGRFLQEAAFMWLRSQRWSGGPPHDLEADPEETRMVDGGQELLADTTVMLPLTLMVPHWNYGLRSSADGLVMLLSATDSPSWARVYPDRVEQGGPRRLWEELEQAHAWWVQRGRPEVSEFGLTVGPQGHVVWLESPDGPSWQHVV
ncbi:MAG: methyltransferase domain-containing protein [Thermobifida fusca]|uniref:methyltransferase domain-containing protein n=1 Tax=Thermobifida TaxID=83677 RepID=UPI002157AB8A|nr:MULTISPECIES: methyltransferase domain-containing protein [Thermobifida]